MQGLLQRAVTLTLAVLAPCASAGAATITFAPPVPYAAGTTPDSVVLADVNGDNKLDAIVGDQPGGASVLLGNGDGTFQAPIALSGAGSVSAVAVGDFNGDGHRDIVIANSSTSTISVFLGDGHGNFSPAPGNPFTTTGAVNGGSVPVAIAVGDFNGDHDDDLFVVNTQGGVNSK